jgi:hypothetical protein
MAEEKDLGAGRQTLILNICLLLMDDATGTGLKFIK